MKYSRARGRPCRLIRSPSLTRTRPHSGKTASAAFRHHELFPTRKGRGSCRRPAWREHYILVQDPSLRISRRLDFPLSFTSEEREYERARRDHLYGFRRLTILGKTDEIEVVVVVGQHGFRFIAEIQEEENVPGGAQHRAGIELMGIDRDPFDLLDQRFPHPKALVGRTHG